MSRRRVDALARLRSLPYEVLELVAEAVIAELDAREGEPDDEAEEDGCEAADDDPVSSVLVGVLPWTADPFGDDEEADEAPMTERMRAGPTECLPLVLGRRA